VVDSETKEPLPEAQMTYKQSYGDNGIFTRSFRTDSLGCFTFYADGRGTLTTEMPGYYSKSKPILAFSDSHTDIIDVGNIELKMSPQMLEIFLL